MSSWKTQKRICKSKQGPKIERRRIPIDVMIVKEQYTGELSGGIEIGPVDPGAAIARVEYVGLEGRV